MKSSANLTASTNARVGLKATFDRWTEPRASGLPNWRVLLWFPVLAALGTTVLVLLNFSGTSSGVEWYSLGTGIDPRLIIGSPRAIRSDEWLVQQSWVVSQIEHGFPGINPTLPGGLDMTVLNELPSWDWSSIFRPHLWGYLFFGIDAGMAWHWWIPALALVSGCYVFVVSILPRRPLTAAFFAVAVFFTPLLQWFYTPSSVWPVAWTFIAMASVVWILTDKRRWVRFTMGGIVGYLAVTMAMGLYIPFMLPGILLVLFFAVGYFLRLRTARLGAIGARRQFIRVLPLIAAGVGSVLVVLMWVVTRLPTFHAIASTVYPGQRTLHTGALLVNDPYLTGVGGAPWSQALKSGAASLLGGNSSEGSSVFLLSVFLVPGLLWFAIRSLRRGRSAEWLLLACLACLALVAAYMLIPGWDALAGVLQLDRVAPERFRILFIPLLTTFAVLTIEQVDKSPSRLSWIPGAMSAALALGFNLILLRRFAGLDPAVLASAPSWILVVGLLVAATFLLFVRRLAPLAALLLLVATVLTTGNVNPVYRGIYDLRQTTIGKEVSAIDEKDPGAWVGVGSYSTMAVLTETGVESFSGVQTYPPKEMWKEIDPKSRYEAIWNRLAHVSWSFESGPPKMTNPSPDVVSVTLDPCSVFAQEHVQYVLSDVGSKASNCLVKLDDIQQGTRDMQIYKIVKPVS